MTQVMVAFFSSELKAVQAVRKLCDLESYGIITVYDMLMIHKKTGGGYEIIEEDFTVDYTVMEGMLERGLLGVLTGPVGFIAGVFGRTAAAAVQAVNHFNFAGNFITEVVEKMGTDTVSVIVETGALTEEFMDVYVRSFDAIVVKTVVDIPACKHFSNEMQANQQAIEAGAMELRKGKNRQVIQAQLTKLKACRQELFTRFEIANSLMKVAVIPA